MCSLSVLDAHTPVFPSTKNALQDPNGLLAVGGNLQTDTLIAAYSKGIFPWYSEGQPILWWSPSPRMILQPEDFLWHRSLRKLARKQQYRITVDTSFTQVMRECANAPRAGQSGTWINEAMLSAYTTLHHAGHAHSVEAWEGDRLVGGLYGVSLGKVFFGESMFSHRSGASKLAFGSLCAQLTAWGYALIDCQVYTEHLASLGAYEIPRDEFEQRLAAGRTTVHTKDWRYAWSLGEYGSDGS